MDNNFSFGASANPQAPVVINPPQQQRQNPFAALLAALGQRPSSGYDPMREANADIARLGGLRHNPQGDANSSYIPGVDNQSSPFSNGFFHSGAAQLSPEAQAATQGRSAYTQWAGLGQVPGVDPTALHQLQGQMTPIPSGNQGEPTVNQFSDPFFNQRMQQGWLGSAAPMGVQMARSNNGVTPQAGNVSPYGSPHVNLPPGAVMGDGTTNYFRHVGATASANPRPGFGFSALR